MAELRRLGYPKIGHCDIWFIEELQVLCLSNHSKLLYCNLLHNSSQYIATNESFGAVTLQSFDVHKALKEICNEIVAEKGALPTW